jgi:hypothetical protein
MSSVHIVIEDPSNTYWEGSLVESIQARKLALAGVALLPVEPNLFRLSSIAGYTKRAWGAGVSLASQAATHVAPLTLFAVPGFATLHWAARLVKDEALQHVKGYNGLIRIANDTQQPGVKTSGLLNMLQAPPELSELGEPDERGGWNIGGSYRIGVPDAAFMGLSLFGTAPGLRLVWLAATQCE